MPRSVSRQSTQQAARVATPAPPPRAGTPAASSRATTAAAGWSPRASSGPLRITAARIDDGIKTTPRLALPEGFSAKPTKNDNTLRDTVHGQPVVFEQSAQGFEVSGPGGRTFTIGADKKGVDGLLNEWRSEVKAAKGEPAYDENMQLNWDSQSTVSGVGTAGKLMSVSLGGSSFTGGAHPNAGTSIATYDARTGKQVKLDELLTPQQMNALVRDVGAKLNSLKGRDGVDGQSFTSGDPADLRATIAENFALTTDKNGKVKIELAWESGVHALGGMTARFTIDAPNDPAFRAKIGLD
ncbi:MAG: hypothetical protein INH41_08850 [Myxococcaceae bacterium]|jgi:hypothetical protein|nr:hypothetical protein [Myxococcaceae bacterium]MCA3012492.1 hypothetical protein [Myxococcaceae bacterium]